MALGISDRLALERTRLANERTILAYLRTGIALVVAGFSLINFFRGYLYVWVGVLLVPVGFGMVVLGWYASAASAKPFYGCCTVTTLPSPIPCPLTNRPSRRYRQVGLAISPPSYRAASPCRR
ncbi:DUF202 domain-containing protein [Hymenobacter fodinae]|uniref:DUF202 domain-containing protein n=1 Tax=Hymenobacter fodinae TaxID=2510796 RepID=A0A4Z0P1B0_9BACT|nr:DUF202 domain-containing protein [Hymenobacter fodinae]